MAVITIAFLLLFSRAALAISWGYILDPSSTNNNVFTQLVYTIQVPAAPPQQVTSDWPNSAPWVKQCGFQPSGGGVVQPVLQWGTFAPSYVNPNPGFTETWALALWDLPASGYNNGNSDESAGIWAAQGDQIAVSVTFENGQWVQTANVISGQAQGQSTSLTVPQNGWYPSDSAGDSNANFFVCESELYGDDTGLWDFPVVFTDMYVRAATSDGIEALCEQHLDYSDGNGYATIVGFSMFDSETCYYQSVTLTPP
ncbi:hypothetical protein CALVIDRAFT_509679 [Calocera viscosa TUFC12733]|uniref:Concanavalin A-like lectin/glucanase n=1 Tax=Calocera viscosa (strain TUFC12733) TaxID=1330018 RepID=A0A167R116_CALVF|nr:hypothetical protein CALVIDRAFT_509679 [Calocera viscosa TUFC12733]